jgi:26S proteasome regulatory subunit T3
MEEIGLAPKPKAAAAAATMDKMDLETAASPILTADDFYTRLKELQKNYKFFEIQEEYVKDEQKNLKRELLRAQEEVKRIQSVRKNNLYLWRFFFFSSCEP